MRSSAGVGITPPKAEGAEKPTSSVMISRMFGAPAGGTICAGQKGFDWAALSLISPLNGGGGGGRYLPSIVVVASGAPDVPVVCCAAAGTPMSKNGKQMKSLCRVGSPVALLRVIGIVSHFKALP
jgi:hypothetical protein